MIFEIIIEPEVQKDIQNAINWYNKQQQGLGRRFHSEIQRCFSGLKTNPFFQIRYDNVRCLPLYNFPYMIHYTVNETDQFVYIRSVIHMSRNPEIWRKKSN